jgi:hypothetical protein
MAIAPGMTRLSSPASRKRIMRVNSPDEDLYEENKDVVPDDIIDPITDRQKGITDRQTTKRSIVKAGSNPSNLDKLVRLNKQGMERLSQGQFLEAKIKFKEAEQLLNFIKVTQEFQSEGYNKLFILTMNNIGCYYKKIFQPNVALKYLKRALAGEI